MTVIILIAVIVILAIWIVSLYNSLVKLLILMIWLKTIRKK